MLDHHNDYYYEIHYCNYSHAMHAWVIIHVGTMNTGIAKVAQKQLVEAAPGNTGICKWH